MRINFKVLALSLLLVYGVAFVGSVFTAQSIDTDWYEKNKPGITPPGFVFGLVWNILFFLIGLSFYFSWINVSSENKKMIIFLFSLNFILNILWSVLFFGLREPLFALIELGFLWLSILILILFLYKKNKLSSFLLLPYLFWVSFAALLNYLFVF